MIELGHFVVLCVYVLCVGGGGGGGGVQYFQFVPQQCSYSFQIFQATHVHGRKIFWSKAACT